MPLFLQYSSLAPRGVDQKKEARVRRILTLERKYFCLEPTWLIFLAWDQ